MTHIPTEEQCLYAMPILLCCRDAAKLAYHTGLDHWRGTLAKEFASAAAALGYELKPIQPAFDSRATVASDDDGFAVEGGR